MDRIYEYNSDTSYKPNGGIYLQLITAKDLYITVAEHNSGHSDSFQVKFPNVFTNYPLGAVRVEDVHILWLYNIMDRIYEYNSDTSYKPNGGIYLQLITAKDLYITVAEHNSGHSDSFQVKFPNVFTNYPLGAVRVEDQRFKDWDHYKFTIWQSQLNFVVFCASSACGVSVEHLNAKEPMIRSIYRFHVYHHIRRILTL